MEEVGGGVLLKIFRRMCLNPATKQVIIQEAGRGKLEEVVEEMLQEVGGEMLQEVEGEMLQEVYFLLKSTSQQE